MSRTHRNQPTHIWRSPKTFNELKANCDDYSDTEYTVSTRHRYIPTLYDDIHISAYQQLDYNH